MDLSSKTGKKFIEGKKGRVEVTIVTTPLTADEALAMYPYRPASKYAESRFGGKYTSR